MKYLLTFLSGAFVGAVSALLFAPKSGEELRTQIRTQAETEFERAGVEWRKAQGEFSAKLDEIIAQIKDLSDQVGDTQEAIEETAEAEA
jgi:gas vesicle protein